VLRTALAPTGALDARERSFLATFARITGFALASADPEPIDARVVAIAQPHARKRLLQLGAMAALLSRPVERESVAFLHALAQRLETYDSVLGVLDALQRGKHVKVRLLAMRRGFRVMLKEAWLAEGPMGVARFASAMWFKTAVNKERFTDYK